MDDKKHARKKEIIETERTQKNAQDSFLLRQKLSMLWESKQKRVWYDAEVKKNVHR